MREVKPWHWQTIRATVAREGSFNSRSVGRVAWNKKMMIPAVLCLEFAWEKLTLKESQLLGNMEKDVVGNVGRFVEEMRSNTHKAFTLSF